MILDRVTNWKRYPFGPAWRLAFEWLEGHGATAPSEVLPLDGETVVVRPGRYATLTREAAALESHRRFADVQVVVTGREWGECHDPSSLTVTAPYDPERDVAFYAHPDGAPARFLLEPGVFALFLPGEAHMTQMATAEPGDGVVKLVVKIDGARFPRP